MGANIGTTAKCCLNLQQALDSISRQLTPDQLMEGLGMIDALNSSLNRSGFEAVQSDTSPKGRPGAGTQPTIEIEYEKPECNAVQDTKEGLCWRTSDPTKYPERTDSRGYLSITVDELKSTGGWFRKDEFSELCEIPSERLANRIRKEARDLKRAINTRLIELAYAYCGAYTNGDPSIGATTKSLNILNGAGHINPAAMAVVKSEYRKMHVAGPPIVVGGDILATWNDTRVVGGLGANAIGASQNSQLLGINLFLDYQIDAVIAGLEADTASHAISFMPGTFQILEWYDYVGYRSEAKPDYAETTIVVDGITYDWSLRYDECEKAWSYEISKNFDLFAIPDEAYQPCWDFNHRLHWELACGDFDCTQYF